jgi:hypothetical protein
MANGDRPAHREPSGMGRAVLGAVLRLSVSGLEGGIDRHGENLYGTLPTVLRMRGARLPNGQVRKLSHAQ